MSLDDASSTIILEVKGLSARYALHNLDLRLHAGQWLTVIGRNGAGKSTLLHCIAGLAEPLSGELLLSGKPILPPSAKLVAGHQKIEILTQQPNLFPNFTVQDNVGYFLRHLPPEQKAQEIDALLHFVDITRLRGRVLREISGGEAQRVGLAKALAKKPDLLLLDEPFSQIDTEMRLELLHNLKLFQKELGLTILMAAHHSAEVLAFSDLVAVLEEGQILQLESAERVFFYPKSLNAATLLGKINRWQGEYYRPTEVRIEPESLLQGKKNGIRAVLSNKQFLGNAWFLSFKAENGQDFTVFANLTDEALKWSLGRVCSLFFEKRLKTDS